MILTSETVINFSLYLIDLIFLILYFTVYFMCVDYYYFIYLCVFRVVSFFIYILLLILFIVSTRYMWQYDEDNVHINRHRDKGTY